jgi:hypothetical protein
LVEKLFKLIENAQSKHNEHLKNSLCNIGKLQFSLIAMQNLRKTRESSESYLRFIQCDFQIGIKDRERISENSEEEYLVR